MQKTHAVVTGELVNSNFHRHYPEIYNRPILEVVWAYITLWSVSSSNHKKQTEDKPTHSVTIY